MKVNRQKKMHISGNASAYFGSVVYLRSKIHDIDKPMYVHKVSLLKTTSYAVYSKDTSIEKRQRAFFRRCYLQNQLLLNNSVVNVKLDLETY